MNLRERLADWISGGALTFMERQMMTWASMAIEKNIALGEIAACETPGANATVRRMARIAREALE